MKNVGILIFLLILFSGCNEQQYNISPNSPLSQPCFDEETKTAKNCVILTEGQILESKKEWKIIAYSLNHKVTTLKDSIDERFFLTFSQGRIGGSFGCNSFFGDYVIKKDSISIKNAGLTRKMCAVMEHENLLVNKFLNAESLKIFIVDDKTKMRKIFFLNNDFYLVLN